MPSSTTWRQAAADDGRRRDPRRDQVEGLPDANGATVWLLFWEDLPDTGDADYNDFVIELRAIPEPSTLLLVAAGLAGLALSRRRRNGA